MAANSSGGDVTSKVNHLKRSKPSKRIIAARLFLKNISLDGKPNGKGTASYGKGPDHGSNVVLRLSRPRQRQETFEEEEDKELISALPATSKLQLHHSTSVACTNIYNDNSMLTQGGEMSNVSKSKSFSDTSSISSGKDKQHISKKNTDIHLVDSRHFLGKTVRNMAHKRAMLVSQNGHPFGSMSLVPYRKHEKNSQLGKEKRTSATMHQAHNNSVVIDGVEVGDLKKVVSYSHLLVPVVFHKRKFTERGDGLDDSNLFHSRDFGETIIEQLYHPYLLDDPELTSGKHRKVLNLKSYSVSVIQYAKPSELKKDINERFKEKFPNTNITLSKLRSIKMDMFEIGTQCGIDKATIACSHVYFEKLVFKEKITKVNRKYCAGACLLLASKFNGDRKKGSMSSIIETIVDRFRLHLKELLSSELLVLIALEFQLCLPPGEINPMYKRLENMRSIVKSRNRYSHRSQHNSRNNHRRRNENNGYPPL